MSRKNKTELEANKLHKRLRHLVGLAINDFQMIQPGDKVMVCLSGGKDSYGLLSILMGLRRSAPVPFDVLAVNLDQKQPGFPEDVLPRYLAQEGIPFRIEQRDTYSVVKRTVAEGKTTCGLCSRLRRGNLYRVAEEEGCTKIALGHHRDDLIETLFLNMFYGGQMKSMSPKLKTDDGKHVVIRPLCYVKEADLAEYAKLMGFPIIPCNLCGSQENLQRQAVKQMLADWEKRHPGRADSIFRSLTKVSPSHLMDTRLFDFIDLDNPLNRAERQDDAGIPTAYASAAPLINMLGSKREHMQGAEAAARRAAANAQNAQNAQNAERGPTGRAA